MLKPMLLIWILTRLRRVVLPVGAGAVLLVLFVPQRLLDVRGWALLLVLLYALLLGRRLSHRGSAGMGFLYTRGYSRDVIWAHTVAGLLIGILSAWLPAALVIWSGLRSLVQNMVLQNPFFPIMRSREVAEPFLWLAACLFTVAASLYAEVRDAQPARDAGGGRFLAVGTIVGAAVLVLNTYAVLRLPLWFRFGAIGAAVFVVFAFVGVGFLLHRSMEIRS